MGEWSDREMEMGYVDSEGNILINDSECEPSEVTESKIYFSLKVDLTPSKYLSNGGRYLRAKLINNELNTSEINLEVLHDKYNDNDPLALEVYCNQIFIGYIQKHTNSEDVNKFCFTDSERKRKITIEWRGNEFTLSREASEFEILIKDHFMEDDGLSDEEAEARAYKITTQDIMDILDEGRWEISRGILVAALFDDYEEDEMS